MAARPGFHYTGEPGARKLTPRQVMRLAHKYGLPARGIMQIAKGESGLDASVQQRDPGDGMVGYGLLQMTPNAWGPAARAHLQKLGGIEALSDPEVNMKMARYLYKSAGNSFKPWYGTRYLTDRSGEGTLGPVRHNVRIPGISGGGGGGSKALKFSPVALAQSLGLSGRTADETQRPTVSAPPLPTFALQGGSGIYKPIETTGAPAPRTRLDIAQRVQGLTGIAPGIPGATSGGGGGGAATPGGGGGKVKGELYELIWRGPGSQTVKNGQPVDRDFYSKHEDHVHVAARQKDLLQLGHIAQRMGLRVSENPAFDRVDPVHVQGSFHYGRSEKPGEHDRAIDVSGDTAKMRKFARRVARLYGL